jgi:hypothetical protein
LRKLKRRLCTPRKHQYVDIVGPPARFSQLIIVHHINYSPIGESYFKDKVIAISGGDNGGMRQPIAELLRRQGARISWASNIPTNALNKRGLNKGKAHRSIVIWYIDVCVEEQVKLWIEETIELWGEIHGCVNLGLVSSFTFLGVCALTEMLLAWYKYWNNTEGHRAA